MPFDASSQQRIRTMVQLAPEEAALVAAVHREISSASWFHRNSVTEWELLKMILFRHSSDDPSALRQSCHEEARRRFAVRSCRRTEKRAVLARRE